MVHVSMSMEQLKAWAQENLLWDWMTHHRKFCEIHNSNLDRLREHTVGVQQTLFRKMAIHL